MDIKTSAFKFEAVKMRMGQDKDGHTITLRLHPHEVDSGDLASLLADHVGSRYMIGMVRIEDDGTPAQPRKKTDAERMVTSAAMLRRDPEFQRYMHEVRGAEDLSEDAVGEAMYLILGVASLADIKAKQDAQERFMTLRNEFAYWLENRPRVR